MQKGWVRPAVAKDLARYEKQSEEEKQSGLKIRSISLEVCR